MANKRESFQHQSYLKKYSLTKISYHLIATMLTQYQEVWQDSPSAGLDIDQWEWLQIKVNHM